MLISTEAKSGRFPLKALLNLAALLCALLAFFMGQEVIARGYVLAFLGVVAVAVFIEWNDLPHPPRLLVDLAALAAFLAVFA
ncbi:MAG: hypothetical protein LBT65_01200, partial [Synergistaceae bacterium]|nr:hypothetical protein [Synergistaceae bacterium]